MRPQIRRLLESAGFTPHQLFAALQGAWLEPKQGSIWQENTGITPTTTGGQTIGLMLDQSQGAVLGPELLANGTFDADLTGWTTTLGSPTVSAGRLTFSGTGRVTQAITCTVGSTYRLQVPIPTSNGASLIRFGIDATGTTGSVLNTGASLSAGAYIYYVTATASTMYLTVGTASLSTFDNISLVQVFGNHATQATAANRPTLQFNGALPLARFDTTDSLSVSLPDLGGGVFGASGSVYFATPVGMSALHNQSMPTTYTLPALSSDIYSWIVVPQRLSAVQEARLARYMQQKAGIAGPDYFEQEDYGPELVVNGTFDTNLDGWTFTGSGAQAWQSGKIRVQSSTNYARSYTAITTVIGTTYRATCSCTNLSGVDTGSYLWKADNFAGGINPVSTTPGPAGYKDFNFIATATTTYIMVGSATSVSVNDFDNISVRELKDGMTGQLTADDGTELLLAQ